MQPPGLPGYKNSDELLTASLPRAHFGVWLIYVNK